MTFTQLRYVKMISAVQRQKWFGSEEEGKRTREILGSKGPWESEMLQTKRCHHHKTKTKQK